MAAEVTFREKVRYRIDNFLDRGSGALFLSLVIGFLGALFSIALLRALLTLLSPEIQYTWTRQLWTIFLELTDPGNMNQDNETPALFKLPAILAGLSGVVIFSALIAFLTTALDQAIAQLRKGHSRVIEEDHTLILGWGPRVVEILRELYEANESEDHSVVVILAEEEKEQMDEYLAHASPNRRNTRVVTRSGPTASLPNLERVAANEAKSAIVLGVCDSSATEEEKLASDAKVIKTVLALEAHLDPDKEFNIVAEIFSHRNRQVVTDISPERVTVVDADEILAKITVQTSRTSGLSIVYSELLSFEGCEMYFHNNPGWAGIAFSRLQYHFPDGVPIGLRTSTGELVVRPALDYVMDADDEILIVADDDSTIEFLPEPVMLPREWTIPDIRAPQKQEKNLIIGWSAKAPIIIREYADYVLEGSEIEVMVFDPPADVIERIQALNAELETVTVRHIDRDPLESAELEDIRPLGYDDVVILPQRPGAEHDPERIDAETIVVLLHIRKQRQQLIAEGKKVTTKLITEVLDSSNQELVSHAGVDDFIISNRMVSMIFAQLSEEPDIRNVYDDLFEEDGSEIYVKPAALYFHQFPMTCKFGDLMRVAQMRDGEVCIGYKIKSLENDSQQNFGVKLIPLKDEEVTLRPEDALVVVAEDER